MYLHAIRIRIVVNAKTAHTRTTEFRDVILGILVCIRVYNARARAASWGTLDYTNHLTNIHVFQLRVIYTHVQFESM